MSASERMSARELGAAIGLAGIFGLRMLGLFIVLPVLALYAARLEGGDDLTLVGIALGAYGLAQAILQIPFGRWSDRVGRKPMLYIGLAIFALGSLVAALATTIQGVIAGRLLQGCGAVSAVAIAMTADLTREEHRAKAMAIIGSMIGASFAGSLVLAPWLDRMIGVDGIFMLTAALALAAMGIVAALPASARAEGPATRKRPVHLRALLRDPDLKRLNVGIFVLHAVLMAMFVLVPFELVQAGLAPAAHWQVYALVMAGAGVFMGLALRVAQRRRLERTTFLVSIGLVLVGQALLLPAPSVPAMGAALLLFFAGFLVLEAALPAQVARVAPAEARGSAIAIYSTVQFLGASCGGALGGYLLQHLGKAGLVWANVGLTAFWLLVASRQGGWSARPLPQS